MKITGATAVMQSLVHEGVEVIFGYPGGAIMPTYDALYHFKQQIRHILVRHEQGAVHAAEGYARATGKPGVVIATSGPGATNLVTGIADAMLDSVPLVCITGQVTSSLLGSDAFQETDVVGVTMPITKWNHQVRKAQEIPEIMAKAFYIASTGRPGPVVVDITKDAQVATLDWAYQPLTEHSTYHPKFGIDTDAVERAAELIREAKRPMILAGHGVLIARASDELRVFAEKLQIPVSTTLHGMSAFARQHPLHMGMLGMHGNYGPNVLTNEADLIIAIGMRFDDRVTGNLAAYGVKAKVIHIDIDPVEVSKNVAVDVALIADAKEAIISLLQVLEPLDNPRAEWLGMFSEKAAIEQAKIITRDTAPSDGKIKMGEVVRTVSDLTRGEAIVVTDVGQHQMITARYYNYKHPDSFITSGGLGTMGFGLPAALGAKVACPERQVVVFVGDGGFQMTIQELGTIAQEGLAVKVVILNNNFLGMVRQWQEMFFAHRYSFVEMKNPDFAAISRGFGVNAKKVEARSELEAALREMLESDGPYVLEIEVEKEENVFPMVPTGSSVSDIRLE